ncbi:MAG: Fe-S cluster assembly protein SufD [Clostridia bacterium]|nr:Fe-S cluster assembly protein SufD [Clostridia bacterium]
MPVDTLPRAPKLSDVDERVVADLSRSWGEPDWLTEARVAAWRRFVELPVPDRHMEVWNRINLRPLPLMEFSAWVPGEAFRAADELPESVRRALGGAGTAHSLVQIDGTPAFRQVGDALERQGVIFCDLQTAAREHPDKVRDALGTVVPADRDKFTALATALWTGGFFLYVPRGVAVELPLQTLRWRSAAADATISRTLVVLDEHASCALIESQAGEGGRIGLDANIVEVVLADGAQLKYVGLQDWDEDMWSFAHRQGRMAGRDSRLTWAFGEFGGRTARSSFLTEHIGRGAESKSVTVFFSSGVQHHDLYQTNLHTGTQTSANMDVRGALAGQGRCVFRGDIEIKRGAKQTSSFEAAHALVLERGARADAIPSLYIDENDVQASHSATTGQVDESQLFYLMSRGLSKKTATKLIVRGFFEPIMEQVPLESVRQEFERLIERKLS